MRRLAAVLVGLVACAAAFFLSAAGGTSGSARVDAIFDSASFLIPGQDVKIAGARVGQVRDIRLTPDNKARIEMEIDPAFVPFHADADCTIQPQSLIGEKFIDCTPGTPRAPALVARDGHAPTVPVANTHSPVDLDLVLATFRRPVAERVSILVGALGAGLAARGEDLNAVIRRANPALQETRRVLDIVDRDRRDLRRLLSASDEVLGTLAKRPERISAFLDRARRATATTADRRRELAATVEGLPPLLRQAQPSLEALATTAQEATPVLADLRSAAPQLRRLAGDVAPLTAAARPALTRLGSASVEGDRALRAAEPVVGLLRRFAAGARPTSVLIDELFGSLKTSGAVENLIRFTYHVTLTLARFDRISHMITPYALLSTCSQYATVTVKSCQAGYSGGATAKRRATGGTGRRPAAKTPAAAGPAPAAGTAPQAPEAATPAPATPQGPKGTTLHLPGLPPITLPPLPGIGGLGDVGKRQDQGDAKGDDNAVTDLLGYLLG